MRLFVLASLLIASLVFADPYQARTLEPAAALSDSELLIRTLRAHHPGYLRYRTNEKALQAEAALRTVAEADIDDASYFIEVCRYLAEVRCEHTEAELPEPLAEWRSRNPTMLPLRFEWVESRAIVTASASEQVRVGDELLSVNGIMMLDLYRALVPLLSVDGFTDHTKRTLYGGRDDIGLTVFDVFFPLLFGFGESFAAEVVRRDGARVAVEIAAITEVDAQRLQGLEKTYRDFSDEDNVVWKILDKGTAYLSVETFVNYRRPVEPDSIYGPAFAAINASGADRLIVDLRRCGGGSDDAAHRLLAHLISEPIEIGGPVRVKNYAFDDDIRPHLSTWNEQIFNLPAALFEPDGDLYLADPAVAGGRKTIQPAPAAWRGDLVVLAGHSNASGATNLLAQLREQRELLVVGEPTGGSAEGCTAGQIVFLTLPNSKITVRVPLLYARNNTTDFEPGMGVTPDVLIEPTVEALRNGQDVTLERAIKVGR